MLLDPTINFWSPISGANALDCTPCLCHQHQGPNPEFQTLEFPAQAPN